MQRGKRGCLDHSSGAKHIRTLTHAHKHAQKHKHKYAHTNSHTRTRTQTYTQLFAISNERKKTNKHIQSVKKKRQRENIFTLYYPVDILMIYVGASFQQHSHYVFMLVEKK